MHSNVDYGLLIFFAIKYKEEEKNCVIGQTCSMRTRCLEWLSSSALSKSDCMSVEQWSARNNWGDTWWGPPDTPEVKVSNVWRADRRTLELWW